MRRWTGRATRGLTLLEVVISIALISILLTALLTFYFESIKVRRHAAELANRMEVARLVLEGIANELRGCLGVEQFGFPVEQRLAGDRRSIRFLTTVLPPKELYQFFGEFDELPAGQHDLRQVGYQLWVDPREETDAGEPIIGGIMRTEKRTLNQLLVTEDNPEEVRNDLWSPELKYLEFRYFDGVEWTTTWDLQGQVQTTTSAPAAQSQPAQATAGSQAGNPLPQLIQITVGFGTATRSELADEDLSTFPIDQYPLGDNLPHADRYSMILRVPAADKFFSSRLQRVGKDFGEQMGVEGGLQ